MDSVTLLELGPLPTG